jgi:hypothetical protein
MLRTFISFGLALAALTPLHSAPIVYFADKFNSYLDGDLVGQGRWYQAPGLGSNLPVQVSGGQISLDRHGAGQNVRANFFGDVTISGGVIYYGFDFTVLETPVNPDFPDYFAGLAANGGIGISALLYIRQEDEGQKFSLGFSHVISEENTFGAELLLGVPYRVIVRYHNVPGDFNDTTDVFVSPVASPFSADENSLVPYLTDGYFSEGNFPEFNEFTGIGFRQADPLAAAVVTGIDNVIVGNEYAVVVPEPATALVLVGGGALLLMRRSRK